MASADSGKSSSSTGDFPEKPHQPRSIKFPMRDTGKLKREFNPKWFDQFTFLHYRENSELPYFKKLLNIFQLNWKVLKNRGGFRLWLDVIKMDF